MIERGVHPDVRLVRRAPERRQISLRPPANPGPQRDYADNVLFIQSDAQLRPVMGRAKAYVIVNAEELAEDAGNRLLKTLEEPPPFVVFLLDRRRARRRAADDCVALCRRSGCAQRRGPSWPRRWSSGGTEPSAAEQLAALAGGRQGWALSAARDDEMFEQQQTYARQLVDAVGGSRLDRLVRARSPCRALVRPSR